MNNYAITFDVDWAPDFAIREAAELLIKHRIKCTWFITHKSDYITELFKHKDLFDFGIHPNFFPGSDHGTNENEIMEYVCSIIPEYKTVRTHVLYQSTRLLAMMTRDFGINTDCSLLLYLTPGIVPHKIYLEDGGKGLVRIPYFWEDDLHMYRPDVEWDFRSEIYHTDGLKIFNFHPMLVYLNSSSMHSYNSLKSVKRLSDLNESEINSSINSDRGIKTFLISLINYLKENNLSGSTISEIRRNFLETEK